MSTGHACTFTVTVNFTVRYLYDCLQVTPCCGILCVILTLFIIRDPARGAADGGTHLHVTSWFSDVKYLLRQYVLFTHPPPLGGADAYVLQIFLLFFVFFSSATIVHKYETTVLGNG